MQFCSLWYFTYFKNCMHNDLPSFVELKGLSKKEMKKSNTLKHFVWKRNTGHTVKS